MAELAARPTIVIVSEPTNPALASLNFPQVDFFVAGTTAGELEAQNSSLAAAVGLLWIPSPGSPSACVRCAPPPHLLYAAHLDFAAFVRPADVLGTLWPKVPNVTWVHAFVAGVDALRCAKAAIACHLGRMLPGISLSMCYRVHCGFC